MSIGNRSSCCSQCTELLSDSGCLNVCLYDTNGMLYYSNSL